MRTHTMGNGDTLTVIADGPEFSPGRQRYTYTIQTDAWEYVGNDLSGEVGAAVNEPAMLRTLASFLSACAESRDYRDSHGCGSENGDIFPEYVGAWAQENSDELSMLSLCPRECASDMGYAHGRSAGGWVIDGNTSDATRARIRQGYDDGDPEVADLEPHPLSGEFADDPTPASVLSDLGMSTEDDEADEVLTAYEEGFSRGFWHAVIEAVGSA